MKKPIPYRYRIERRPATSRRRWALGVVLPNGGMQSLTTYATRQAALSAARVLAGHRGEVEIYV